MSRLQSPPAFQRRELEPILIKPKAASELLACSLTRVYELMADAELESFRDGRSRKITLQSIRQYVERKLARALPGTDAVAGIDLSQQYIPAATADSPATKGGLR
jgi:excisionase family DNA binding protein